MYPEKPEDFYVPEKLGDLMFLGTAPTVYYAYVEYERAGMDMRPKKVHIREIKNPDFKKVMDGHFTTDRYVLWFEFGKDAHLRAESFGKEWSFDKNDVLKYVRSSYMIQDAPLVDETSD